jgi:hypothetical protein
VWYLCVCVCVCVVPSAACLLTLAQAVAAAAGRDAQAAVDAATAARAEAADVGSALALVQGAAYDGPRKAALGLREELLQVRTDTPGPSRLLPPCLLAAFACAAWVDVTSPLPFLCV